VSVGDLFGKDFGDLFTHVVWNVQLKREASLSDLIAHVSSHMQPLSLG
jgi:hypothetical protein